MTYCENMSLPKITCFSIISSYINLVRKVFLIVVNMKQVYEKLSPMSTLSFHNMQMAGTY